MDLPNDLVVVAGQRTSFVGPGKDRAFEILHLAVTLDLQTPGRLGGTISDRTIGDDRHLLRNSSKRVRRIAFGIKPSSTRQMAYFPLRTRAHIEQDGGKAMRILQPVGELGGRNPLHIAEFNSERMLDQEPIKIRHRDQINSDQESRKSSPPEGVRYPPAE